MKLQDLMPEVDERLTVVGSTGSGKTTLVKMMCDEIGKHEPVIIIDTKPSDIWGARPWWHMRSKSPYVLIRNPDLRKLPRPYGYYVYRPAVEPPYADPGLDLLFHTAMIRVKGRGLGGKFTREQRNCTIVIDELLDLSRAGYVRPALGKLWRAGREKHVRLIAGTQRPFGIPLLALSEASKYISFYLKRPDDLKRMGTEVDPVMGKNPPAMAGDTRRAGERRVPHHFDFWFKNDIQRSAPILVRQEFRKRADERGHRGNQ